MLHFTQGNNTIVTIRYCSGQSPYYEEGEIVLIIIRIDMGMIRVMITITLQMNFMVCMTISC